ncbi:MAG: peptidylprolyl isomerase [Chitinophagales bacterium]
MRYTLSFLFAIAVFTAAAQKTTADKIVAIVGDNIILQSEIEAQYQQQLANNPSLAGADGEEAKCRLFDNLMLEKLFVAQANLDSLVVTQDEIDAELDRRVKYFINLFGSREKLEEYNGKTIAEMKDEFTDDVRSQLLSDKMRSKVFTGMKVSPQEVKDFFAKIPKDSIPYFNSEVEIAQVVMFPKVSEEQKELARKKLERIKKAIEDGADFSLQAILYSEDPGSASDGGNLGMVERGELVPEFEAVAYKLDEKKMSDITETPFGYHLIMVDEKRGNRLKLRHILIKPKSLLSDLTIVKERMDSIQHQLATDSMSFRDAVKYFSDDENSKGMGGLITNPKTGNTTFEKSEVDGSLIFTLDNLKVGEVSPVLPYSSMERTGEKKEGYRIILLKSETKPHKASLESDYSRIQAAAKQKKQQEELARWVSLNKDHVFIKLDNQYAGCKLTQKWLKEEKQ